MPRANAQGTFPSSINAAGAITGIYLDASYLQHDFLRAPDGSFTTIDAPGATATDPVKINGTGAITGFYT